NLSLGILGIGLPLLSSTWTSTVTTFVSDLKLASVSTSSPFDLGLSLEGILGRSLSEAVPGLSPAGFLRGFATVSLDCGPGLSCAQTPTIRVSAASAAKIQVFIRVLPL